MHTGVYDTGFQIKIGLFTSLKTLACGQGTCTTRVIMSIVNDATLLPGRQVSMPNCKLGIPGGELFPADSETTATAVRGEITHNGIDLCDAGQQSFMPAGLQTPLYGVHRWMRIAVILSNKQNSTRHTEYDEKNYNYLEHGHVISNTALG